MYSQYYCHMLEGRLRIKVPEVKHARSKAYEVETTLRAVDGIEHVQASHVTGNVLVLFDPGKIDHDQIAETIRSLDCLNTSPLPSSRPTSVASEFLFRTVTEVVVERAILALL